MVLNGREARASSPNGPDGADGPRGINAWRTVAVVLEYAGEAFHGFQAQGRRPELPTVQETVEKAIAALTGEQVRITGAGRTDAGVHAIGQVISFRTGSRIPVERWPAALNSRLPPEIRAWQAFAVADGFDARRHARRKLYRYRFYLSPVVSALADRQAAAVTHPLDLEAMARAALLFEGEHDLRAFCGAEGARRVGRASGGFRRRIFRCRLLPDGEHGMWPGWTGAGSHPTRWSPGLLWPPGFMESDGEEQGTEKLYVLTAGGRLQLSPRRQGERPVAGEEVEAAWFERSAVNAGPKSGAWSLWVEADGFLYHQIRTMMGTLWETGRGERSPESLTLLLQGRARTEAGPTAPAQGLYLVAVAYPGRALGL
mgnify:CR=1 FL=1